MPPFVANENFVTTFEMPPEAWAREPDLFFEGLAPWLFVELGFKGASGWLSWLVLDSSAPAIVMLFWFKSGRGFPITDLLLRPDLSMVIGLLLLEFF